MTYNVIRDVVADAEIEEFGRYAQTTVKTSLKSNSLG